MCRACWSWAERRRVDPAHDPELARSVPAYARQMGWIVGDPAAVLVVEFSGEQVSALKERFVALFEDFVDLRDHSTSGLIAIAESKEEQARVWNVRKMGLGILDSRPQAAQDPPPSSRIAPSRSSGWESSSVRPSGSCPHMARRAASTPTPRLAACTSAPC
jgi:hypothetical protein